MAGRFDLAVVRGQPAGEDIKQDRNGAGHERRDDHGEPNDEDVDPEPVGEAGANAHDLGLGRVEDKATVHGLIFLFETRWT